MKTLRRLTRVAFDAKKMFQDFKNDDIREVLGYNSTKRSFSFETEKKVEIPKDSSFPYNNVYFLTKTFKSKTTITIDSNSRNLDIFQSR